jgi:Tfp pilus assembly protein PilN
MKAVNLLPPDRRQATRNSPLAPLARQPLFAAAGVVVAVVAITLGIVAHSASSSVGQKRQQLAEVQAQLALNRPSRQKLSASAVATASSRRAAIVSVAQRRLSWDAFLGSLSRVTPEDVWLVGLTANPLGTTATAPPVSSSTSSSSSPATATAPATPFTITGYTYSQSSVARLLDRLALVPWLSQVQLTSDSLAPLGTRTVFQFSIGASIANTGGAS